MKKFTLVSSAAFVVLFIGMLLFVAFSEDFEAPQGMETAQTKAAEEERTAIWDMSYEEVAAKLEKLGFIDSSSSQLLAQSGLCTRAEAYNGAELYWWDVEQLDEASAEYKAYASLRDEGFIDLYGAGIIMNPIPNGPYALLVDRYEGDADALKKAFENLGSE